MATTKLMKTPIAQMSALEIQFEISELTRRHAGRYNASAPWAVRLFELRAALKARYAKLSTLNSQPS